MTRSSIISFLLIMIFSAGSCTTKSRTSVEDNQELSVKGEITEIETGKDGYVATIKDADGKEYYATISIVNLQKRGNKYEGHKVGDKIAVTGAGWKDAEGKAHITVYELK